MRKIVIVFPPAGDYSVVFLGNLFGIVDGVLHGTGSQIMGAMFSVFNSAVLAIGGVIITYTMTVSTLNTANEGQLLGQKWSSIWIPVRSVAGLALLIPKHPVLPNANFVMWIAVQGWVLQINLGHRFRYMNRGGVIIQAQANPGQALLGTQGSAIGIADGAMTIWQDRYVCWVCKNNSFKPGIYIKAKPKIKVGLVMLHLIHKLFPLLLNL